MKRTLIAYASVLAMIVGVRMVSADGFRPIGATLGANTFVGQQTITGGLTASGSILAAGFGTGPFLGPFVQFGGGGGKSRIVSPVDGQVQIQNNAGTVNATLLALTVQTTDTTVAGLGTCTATNKDQRWAVTDATSPTYLAALTGGGSTYSPALCNGTAWVSGG